MKALIRKLTALRWRFLSKKDAAALIDSLRRCTELLDGGDTDYYRAEREHQQMVARRLIRHYDPASQTDRTVA